MNYNKVFVLLQVCNSLTMIGTSLITPFFPPFAYDKGISQSTMGYIIAANPVGSLTASLLLGKVIKNNNRFWFIIIGLFAQGIALLLFVLLKWFDDYATIIVVATISRFIGGLGTSSFITPFYAYIPIIYPNQVEKRIGISEFVSGGSQLVGILRQYEGPVIGSLLFSVGGYIMPFLALGGINVLIVPFLMWQFLPLHKIEPKLQNSNERNERNESNPDISRVSNQSVGQKIASALSQAKSLSFSTPRNLSYFKAMTKYPIIMQTLVVLFCNVCFTYFQPILANFLIQTFSIQQTTIGYLMTIITAFYAFGTFVSSQITTRKRLGVIMGLITNGFGYIFIGPDPFTGLGSSIYLTLGAQGVSGFGAANMYIPAVPIMNEVLQFYYPNQKLQTSNMASALFTSSMAVGNLIGPIISGSIAEVYGFERACGVLGVSLLLLGVLYVPMLFLDFTIKRNKIPPKQEETTSYLQLLNSKVQPAESINST